MCQVFLLNLNLNGNRTVIRTGDLCVNDRVFDHVDGVVRHEEVVNAPTGVVGPGVKTVGPPGVLDGIRMQMAVSIHIAVFKEMVEPLTLHGQEARAFSVGFGIFQVHLGVRGIDVTADNDLFTLGHQGVDIL